MAAQHQCTCLQKQAHVCFALHVLQHQNLAACRHTWVDSLLRVELSISVDLSTTDKDGLNPAELGDGEGQAEAQVLSTVQLHLASIHPAASAYCLQWAPSPMLQLTLTSQNTEKMQDGQTADAKGETGCCSHRSITAQLLARDGCHCHLQAPPGEKAYGLESHALNPGVYAP